MQLYRKLQLRLLRSKRKKQQAQAAKSLYKHRNPQYMFALEFENGDEQGNKKA